MTVTDYILKSAAHAASERAELIWSKTGLNYNKVLEDCVMEVDCGPGGFNTVARDENSVWDEIIATNVHFSLAEKSAILAIAQH